MSDLSATGCGCGCGDMSERSGCNSCNIIIWLLILSCICGGDHGSLFGGSLFGGDGCGCSDHCGCNWIWIIILLIFIR